jgi:hypothetical protein
MPFVVLEHFRGPLDRPDHFDLMFTQPTGGLRTWSIRHRLDSPGWQQALALPDHRAAYLSYEGPTKRGGGWVRHWTRGTFRPLVARDGCWRSLVSSPRLHGLIELARDAAGSWRYTFRQR